MKKKHFFPFADFVGQVGQVGQVQQSKSVFWIGYQFQSFSLA